MPRKTAPASKKASGPSTRIVAAWLDAGFGHDRIAELCGISREQAAEAVAAALELTAKLREQDAALQAQHGIPVRTEAEWLRSDVYLVMTDLRRRLSRVLSRREVAGDEVDAARDRIHDATLAARAMWLAGRDQESLFVLLDAWELLGMLRHDPSTLDRQAQKRRSDAGVKARKEEDGEQARRVKTAKHLHESGYAWPKIVKDVAKRFEVSEATARKDCKEAGRK